jgi:adenylyltransferase/sulfurtransferase
MTLAPDELQRYARHLAIPSFGPAVQEKLLASSVLVVGCGGLGSPLLSYLAAAGVGRIGFVDPDLVELSNLQRQVLHATTDIGRLKTRSAEARLRALNPRVRLEPFPLRFSRDNARRLCSSYDAVADASDSYPVKFLLSDTCVALRKPFAVAGLSPYTGQLFSCIPGASPCLRCLYPEPPPPPPAPPAGPVSPLPGVMGSLLALEILKLLTGLGAPLANRLLFFDALSSETRIVQTARRPGCPSCGRPSRRAQPRKEPHP